MATRYILVFLFCFAIGKAQTISFRGCQALFENQDYIFTPSGADATGRNMYITTPVTGDQHCGGVGTCEFKIIWNTTLSRWEFIADAGNGGFSETFTIYYNTSASLPNPPSLTLGSWVENTPTTQSLCGGNLTSGNATLSGAVQNTVLATSDFEKQSLMIFPNPVTDMLTVRLGDIAEGQVSVFNNLGQMVKTKFIDKDGINVSDLQAGIYIIRLEANDKCYVNKFIKL